MSQLTPTHPIYATRRLLLHLGLLALASGVIAPTAVASVDRGGACVLEFHVLLGAGGAIEQNGVGVARCAGLIGDSNIDPSPVPAFLSASVRAGASGCTPVLTRGHLGMDLKRLISFDPDNEMRFEADWWATGVGAVSAVSGSADAAGIATSFVGEASFTPAYGKECAFRTSSGGTLEMDLFVGDAAGVHATFLRGSRNGSSSLPTTHSDRDEEGR